MFANEKAVTEKKNRVGEIFKFIFMSKKILKKQAEELLSSELVQIKGGLDPFDEIIDDCTCCEAGCLSSCMAACIKGKSQG
ncbi:MAG: hypothetical protein KDC67_00480 [Ignavibacteriae bacterium]|nr:hypothetical protein [Ignavibacteriota bacterium]